MNIIKQLKYKDNTSVGPYVAGSGQLHFDLNDLPIFAGTYGSMFLNAGGFNVLK